MHMAELVSIVQRIRGSVARTDKQAVQAILNRPIPVYRRADVVRNGAVLNVCMLPNVSFVHFSARYTLFDIY